MGHSSTVGKRSQSLKMLSGHHPRKMLLQDSSPAGPAFIASYAIRAGLKRTKFGGSKILMAALHSRKFGFTLDA